MNKSRSTDLPQFKSCRNNQQSQEPLFASSFVPRNSQIDFKPQYQHFQLGDSEIDDTEKYKDFKKSHVLPPCLHRQQEQKEIYSVLMQVHSLDQQRQPPPVPPRSRLAYTAKSQYQSVDCAASNFNTFSDKNDYNRSAGLSSGNISSSYNHSQYQDYSPHLTNHFLKIIVTPNTVQVLSCGETKDANSRSNTTAIISDLTARLAAAHADCDADFQSSGRLLPTETLARYLWSVQYHLLQEQALFPSPSSGDNAVHAQLRLLSKFWQFFANMSTTAALTCSLIEDHNLASGISSDNNGATKATTKLNTVPFWLAAKSVLAQTGAAALGAQLHQDGIRALLHLVVAVPEGSPVPVEAIVIVHDGSTCKPALLYDVPAPTMADESCRSSSHNESKAGAESISAESTKCCMEEEISKSTVCDVGISILPTESLPIPPKPKVELMRRGAIHADKPRIMLSAPLPNVNPTATISRARSRSPQRHAKSSGTSSKDLMSRNNSSSLDCLFRDYLEAAQRFVEMPLVDSRKYTVTNREEKNDKSYGTLGLAVPAAAAATTTTSVSTHNAYTTAKPEFYKNGRARNHGSERDIARVRPEPDTITNKKKYQDDGRICDSYFSEFAPNLGFCLPPPVPEKDLKYRVLGAQEPTLDSAPAHIDTKTRTAQRFSTSKIETSHWNRQLSKCSGVSVSSVNLSKDGSVKAETYDTAATEELAHQPIKPQVLTSENVPETMTRQTDFECLSILANSDKELFGQDNGDSGNDTVGKSFDADASEESTHTGHHTFPKGKSISSSNGQGDMLASTCRRYRGGLRVWLRGVFRAANDPDACVWRPPAGTDGTAQATGVGANDTSPSQSSPSLLLPSPPGNASFEPVGTAQEISSTENLLEPHAGTDQTHLTPSDGSRPNLVNMRARMPLGLRPSVSPPDAVPAAAARVVNEVVPRPQIGSAMEHELLWRSAWPPPIAVSRIEFRRLRTSTFEPNRLPTRSLSNSSSSSMRSISSNRNGWMRPGPAVSNCDAVDPEPSVVGSRERLSLQFLSDNSDDDDDVVNGSAAATALRLTPTSGQHEEQELREYYNVPMFRTLSVISSEHSPRSTLWIDNW
jgi:hypothetical protein